MDDKFEKAIALIDKAIKEMDSTIYDTGTFTTRAIVNIENKLITIRSELKNFNELIKELKGE